MIRFATVGTSKITEHFLEAAALVPELEYDASFSRDAAKAAGFAENHGAKRHFSDMLRLAQDSSIDAVYIATPNVFHALQSRLFLENGKHVLCEKPITCTPEEYAGLHALAAKNGLVYMEGMMSVNVPWHSEVSAALGVTMLFAPGYLRISLICRFTPERLWISEYTVFMPPPICSERREALPPAPRCLKTEPTAPERQFSITALSLRFYPTARQVNQRPAAK